MNAWRCGVVVTARDEQGVIEGCLKSLRRQTLRLFVVVVDDGSVDKTGQIASKYVDFVVDLPRHEESWAGRPEFAGVINAGFDVLKRKNVDYVMTSGADAIYPCNYVEEVTKRMEGDGVVLASGVAESEVSRSLSPRGCGRVIDAEWFRRVGFRYPENYGFEGYLVYKALSQGKKVIVFPDLKFRLSRGTRFSKKKLYLWGKAMKTLNYWWPYAMGRIVIMGLKHPRSGCEMLKGFLSSAPKYKDVEKFIRDYQAETFWHRVREVVQSS